VKKRREMAGDIYLDVLPVSTLFFPYIHKYSKGRMRKANPLLLPLIISISQRK
jgi:hypothetical protein